MKNIRFLKLGFAVLLLFSKQVILAQEKFFGEVIPTAKAELFAPGKISTQLVERDFAITTDHKEIYYSVLISTTRAVIVCHKWDGTNWSSPQEVPFSSMGYDIEPFVSADGKTLYFASNRQISGDGVKDFDIWYASRKSDGSWGEAVNIGAPINTTGSEFYPSVADNGTLYYTGKYANGIGGEDIWYAEKQGDRYATPKVLPASVNSVSDEFNAFIDPLEKFILFSDNSGSGDMKISLKNESGQWKPSQYVPLEVNQSNVLDYCPFVTRDGKVLFFTSERFVDTLPSSDPFNVAELVKAQHRPGGKSNIYWISFEEILKKIN